MTYLIKGRRLIVLPLTTNDPALFEEIFALEDLGAVQEAFYMAQLFQNAVVGEGHFDLAQAINIARQDPNMSMINSLDRTLSQDNDRVSEMVNGVVLTLNDFLNMTVPQQQQEQFEAAITYTFTNLYMQEMDGWIFYNKKSSHSTTYQYNILFAVQNLSTGGYIYGIPMGMTIKVDREYERVLFITLKDEVSYSVRIEALKVALPLQSYVDSKAFLYLQNSII